ncbi:MAG: NAD(P)H-hydrate dehydratase [Acidiphilium sp.]|nr:NAD(P)H-hydrate dehydratase [Acidiphilium sp.]MDD4936483.1 NAD(P)H-hydrate dehydratase [Acidiphilium sp.]
MEPLFTPDAFTAIDRAAPDCGVALLTLMENAGTAVARAIIRRYPPRRVLVLAGPGNNGGDGYVAARILEQNGWPVAVAPIALPRPGTDAAIAAAKWRGPVVSSNPGRVREADLVIDAVFGAGLSRDVSAEAGALFAAAKTLIAIDVPSGVDGATGVLRGPAATAVLTITFVARKPGHLLFPGRAHCGTTLCADIGMPRAAVARMTPMLWHNAPGLWHLPDLDQTGHKYDRGHLTILAGALAGAALLAANAARRAGAGLVTIAAEAEVSGASPGIMIRRDPLEHLLDDARRHVWLCGPGLGISRAGAALEALIAAKRGIVADADALTACAQVPDRLRGVTVITPHEGEFARIFPDLAGDKLSRAREGAARIGAVVVLKGADTVIAAPDGRAAINDNAPASLATAGSGDTLAGIIAGLLTQGMPGFEAACAAVWLHGAAAQHIGTDLIAEDLADALGTTMATLRKKSRENTT